MKRSRCFARNAPRLASLLALAGIAALALGACGQDETAPGRAGGPSAIAPGNAAASAAPDRADAQDRAEALALLDKMVRTYRDASTLRVDITLAERLLGGQTGQELTQAHQILYERPGKYLRRDTGTGEGGSIYSNGQVAFLHRADQRATIRIETDMLEEVILSDALSASLVIPVVLLSNNGEGFINRARPMNLRMLGETTVDGTRALTIAYRDRMDREVELDIAADPPHVLLRQSTVDGESGVQLERLFTNQATDMEFAPGEFEWRQPQDATLYSNTEQFILEQRRGGEARGLALEGRRAPRGTLVNLDGGAVVLSEHVGRDVILIDFWATWCAPCRRTLPALNRIARQFQGQGFVFVPVAFADDHEDIRAFLSEHALDAVPPLVPQGSEMIALYNVGPLPHTVLVGRDGIVRDVEVGAPADIGAWEAGLAREIERLLRE